MNCYAMPNGLYWVRNRCAGLWTSTQCNTITSTMEPHQHHHRGHAHPPATVSPSILRLSALERLTAVAVLIVALWGAVIWAMA